MGKLVGEVPSFYTAGTLRTRHATLLQRTADIEATPRHLRDDNSYDELTTLGREAAILGALTDSTQILAGVFGEEVTFPVPTTRVGASTMRRAMAMGLTPLLKPHFPTRETIAAAVADRRPHPLKTGYDKSYLTAVGQDRVSGPDTYGLVFIDKPGKETDLSKALEVDLSTFDDPEQLAEAIAPKKANVLMNLHMPADADIRVATPDDLVLLRAVGKPAEGATRTRVIGTEEQVVFTREGRITTRKPGEPLPVPLRLVIVTGVTGQSETENKASDQEPL